MSFVNELKRRNVIRVAAGYIVFAWLIIQVAGEILPTFHISESVNRLVIIGLAVGFLPVVVLAWVFEWTPEGIKVDEGLERRGPAVAAAAKRWDRIVIAILAISVTYFIIEKLIEDIETPPTIAVLPFTVLSSDVEQEYLAVGIAEDVRGKLAQIPQFQVTWHVSSFSPRLNGLELAEIADKLDVAHLVIGTVRRQGESLRITSQLVDTRQNHVVWGQTFDRRMGDLFEIQEQIARSIVANLHEEILGPLPSVPSTDPKVLALVVQAAQVFFDGYGGEWAGMGARMAALLDKAIELDPNYAPAYAWYLYAEGARFLAGEIEPEEELRRRNELIRKALSIDPDEPMVLQQLGFTEVYENGDPEAAASYYERALRNGADNAEVLRMVGRFAYLIDRYDEANLLLERSAQINPLCTSCIYHLSRSYMITGRFEDALAMRERFMLLVGENGQTGSYHYGLIKLLLDDAEGALEVFSNLERTNDPATLAGMAMALYSLGRRDESDQVLSAMAGMDGRDAAESRLDVYAWRGDLDLAFGIIDEFIGDNNADDFDGFGLLTWWRLPQFQKVRDDARWTDVRARLGWPKERTAAIDVELSLPSQE